jgi:hypothetical protein
VLFCETDGFVESLGGVEGRRHVGLPVREYAVQLSRRVEGPAGAGPRWHKSQRYNESQRLGERLAI